MCLCSTRSEYGSQFVSHFQFFGDHRWDTGPTGGLWVMDHRWSTSDLQMFNKYFSSSNISAVDQLQLYNQFNSATTENKKARRVKNIATSINSRSSSLLDESEFLFSSNSISQSPIGSSS